MTAGITADEASPIPLSPPTDPGRRTYFPGLDGLRGIAVLLVVAVHFFPQFKMSNWAESWLAKIPENGWTGVDLFFVLSGFLITGILIDASDKPHRFRNFYMRRVLRIFPLYLGVLVVVLWLIPDVTGLELPPIIRTNQAWLWFHLSNVKMVLENDYIFNTGWVNLAHLWTLAVEEHFYLVWPAAIFFVPRAVGLPRAGMRGSGSGLPNRDSLARCVLKGPLHLYPLPNGFFSHRCVDRHRRQQIGNRP